MFSGLTWIIIIGMLLFYDIRKDKMKSVIPRQLIEHQSIKAVGLDEAYDISVKKNDEGYCTEIICVDKENDLFHVRIFI